MQRTRETDNNLRNFIEFTNDVTSFDLEIKSLFI